MNYASKIREIYPPPLIYTFTSYIAVYMEYSDVRTCTVNDLSALFLACFVINYKFKLLNELYLRFSRAFWLMAYTYLHRVSTHYIRTY